MLEFIIQNVEEIKFRPKLQVNRMNFNVIVNLGDAISDCSKATIFAFFFFFKSEFLEFFLSLFLSFLLSFFLFSENFLPFFPFPCLEEEKKGVGQISKVQERKKKALGE